MQTLDFTRRHLKIDGSSSAQEKEWFHDVYRRDVVKVELEPHAGEPFSFETTIRALPDLTVSRTRFSPMVSRRRKQATADDALILGFVLAGEATLIFGGDQMPMPAGAGTYARCDARDADAALGMNVSTTMLGLRLSRRLIEPLVRDYENLERRVIPCGAEVTRLLATYLDALEQQEAITTPEARRLVVNHVYDLTALAIGTSRERAEMAARGLAAARLTAIKSHILENLQDPGLSAATAAVAQGVTARYIHMLFEAEGTTFSEYVVARRLTQAYRMLGDPRLAAEKTISAIALHVGFSDLSYFNRTFRRRFGMTPRDVRAAALQAAGVAKVMPRLPRAARRDKGPVVG